MAMDPWINGWPASIKAGFGSRLYFFKIQIGHGDSLGRGLSGSYFFYFFAKRALKFFERSYFQKAGLNKKKKKKVTLQCGSPIENLRFIE